MLLSADTLLLKRYLIVRHIGYSGTTILYEAKDQRLNHFVILKQNMVTGVSLQQKFERQAQILAPLRHANVSDCFTNQNCEFSVIEEEIGDDLESLLNAQGRPFVMDQVLEWASQLLYTLEYLHSRPSPIIHGNIKPCNIQLLSQNEVILLNVGMSHENYMNRMAFTSCRDYYASLEQVNGLSIDARSDLYSLGATLYYLLTGIEPPTAITRMYALMNQLPDPLRAINELEPQIPFELADLLTTAMKLSPIERPSSARAMRQAGRLAGKAGRHGQKAGWPALKALHWVAPKVGSVPQQKKRVVPQAGILHPRVKKSLKMLLKAADGLVMMVLLLAIAVKVDIYSMFTIHGDTILPTPVRLVIPTPGPSKVTPVTLEEAALGTEEATIEQEESLAKTANVSVEQAESALVGIAEATIEQDKKAISSERANTLSSKTFFYHTSLPTVIDETNPSSSIVKFSTTINPSEQEVNVLAAHSETLIMAETNVLAEESESSIQEPESTANNSSESTTSTASTASIASTDVSHTVLTTDSSSTNKRSIITLKEPLDRAIYLCNERTLISFKWQSNKRLQSNQYFQVRIWQDGAAHNRLVKTNENAFDINPMELDAGQYFWSVAVMDKTTNKEVISEASPRILIIR